MRGFSSNNLALNNYAKGYTGEGVEIAIVDTGMEINHEDLINNVIVNGSYNFASSSNGKGIHDTTSTKTEGDHGTSVAGLTAARGGNEIGITGVAPKASLRGFNLLAGNSGLSEEIASLGGSIAGFSSMQSNTVSVFNKSYGRNPNKVLEEMDDTSIININAILSVMRQGTETLRDNKGALYIKAAGNEYRGGRAFDESYCSEPIAKGITCYNANQEPENVTPYQIVVGAFNAGDKRSSYSNTGSAIWVAGAGGEYGRNHPAMMTTDQSGCVKGYSRDDAAISVNTLFNRGDSDENTNCNYISSFNGTSSAAPTVSGVVALILEANPSATWRDVKYILAKTARKLDPSLAARTISLSGNTQIIDQAWTTNSAGFNFSNEYGFGAVDIISAVTLAEQRQNSNIHIAAMQTTIFDSASFSNTIPNASQTGLTKALNSSSSLTLESVELRVDISAVTASSSRRDNKIDASDYLIELTSPSGTKSIMMTPFNAYLSGYDMPNLKMISHAFYGESASGSWTLKITDVDGSTSNYISHVGTGKLNNFSLTFYGN